MDDGIKMNLISVELGFDQRGMLALEVHEATLAPIAMGTGYNNFRRVVEKATAAFMATLLAEASTLDGKPVGVEVNAGGFGPELAAVIAVQTAKRREDTDEHK